MRAEDNLLYDEFCKHARYYPSPLGRDHHYAIRSTSGRLLTSNDTESLFSLYCAAEAAVKVVEILQARDSVGEGMR